MPALKIADISEAEVGQRLGDEGLVFRVGPFVSRLRSDIPEIARHLHTIYGAFPLLEADSVAGCVLSVRFTPGLRRLLRPQARVDVDAPAPFVPMKPEHSPLLFETGLNWVVATRGLSHLILHAGVIARDGRAVIIPGLSGQGKSTLAAGLSRRGWRYLSDEFALVDLENQTVHPYPRPASLKNESIDVIAGMGAESEISATLEGTPKGRIAYLTPDINSIRAMDQPAEPALIMIPKFEAQSAPASVPIAPAEGFMLCTLSSVNYDRFGRRGFDALSRLIDQATVHQVTYPDLESAADIIEGLLDG